MEEIWKDIKEFEGKYQVSNFGRVRNTKSGRILKNCLVSFGYYQVYFSNGKGKTIGRRVNRLVAEAFLPNPDNLPQVDHKDGNKQNNNVSNLEWVSASENVRRSIKGRKKRTQNNSPVFVLKEGKMLKKCNSIAEAAKFIGCGKTSVQRVLRSDFQNTIFGFSVKYA